MTEQERAAALAMMIEGDGLEVIVFGGNREILAEDEVHSALVI